MDFEYDKNSKILMEKYTICTKKGKRSREIWKL